MNSRRDFLKKAALLAGTSASINWLPDSIKRALAIDATPGSTYLDAEHVVFLMQENRSFDHCFGTLKGVRGFNDPRAMRLPNGLPVWIQGNKKGQYFAPFHLDIVHTKSTWMGSLPHGWRDMVAARNHGKMDNWLEAKSPGYKEYKDIPLTMGYYNRADIPFYYAFADAFTICDQHFCSSLTGTSANRSYFWSGTIRENPRDPNSIAHVDNGQINYKNVSWKTFPERLEEAGVSWKVYQNELSLPVGLNQEEEDWLANFTDNNLEFYKQYHVRFHPKHRAWMQQRIAILPSLIDKAPNQEEKDKLETELSRLQRDVETYSEANFKRLRSFEQAIHQKAFVTNVDDPNYHQLASIPAKDGDQVVKAPAGDIFYQFRKDVDSGQLPTVSWLVAPCRFSDHPGSPWFGAWYVSEALDILTKNPEVWKKTIFILTYDENDGYFDHISPFVPPLTSRPEEGKVSPAIDTTDEYVTQEQERIRTGKADATLDSPIGLGYRVPMIVASPWTKGGWVNSEVFDLTSNLKFLEHFIEKKKNIRVREDNISAWRRMVCGDLTSVFRPVEHTKHAPFQMVDRDAYIERIYTARHKQLPTNYKEIKEAELEHIRQSNLYNPKEQLQEVGTKPACALPLELHVHAGIKNNKLLLEALVSKRMSSITGEGIPFQMISYTPYKGEVGNVWNFAVAKNDILDYALDLADFEGATLSLAIHGPNGFYRAYKARKVNMPTVIVKSIVRLGKPILQVHYSTSDAQLQISDTAYKLFKNTNLKKGVFEIDCSPSKGWYAIEITSPTDNELAYHFAGHIETGEASITDPLMGKVV